MKFCIVVGHDLTKAIGYDLGVKSKISMQNSQETGKYL